MEKYLQKFKKILLLLLLLIAVSAFVFFQLRNPDGAHAFYHVLGIKVSLYGAFISLGIIVCMIAFEFLKTKELDTLNVVEAAVWTLLPAIIFARGWHVLSEFSVYHHNLSAIFNLSSGGMSIWGGVLGGLIGGAIFCYTHGFDINLGINLVSVVLPLGQMVGRLGNFVNQELFGRPTDEPWGMYVRLANRPVKYLNSQYFHPAFLYEMIGSLILFFLLLALYKLIAKKHFVLLEKSFVLGALYLIGYGIIRFLVEFYRLENHIHFGFSSNQFIAGGFVLTGLIYMLMYYLKTRYDKKA